MMTSVRISAREGPAGASAGVMTAAPGGAPEPPRRAGRLDRAQQLERLAELLRPRVGGGIVERDHEIGFGGGLQTALDRGPGPPIVRARDGAEINPDARAAPGP